MARKRSPREGAEGLREEGTGLDPHGTRQERQCPASLRPEYLIDDEIMMLNVADNRGGEATNKCPTVEIEGATRRSVRVGQPVLLAVSASDDGKPKPRPAPPPFERDLLVAGPAGGVVRVSGRRREGDVRSGAVQTLSGLPEQLTVDARLGAAARAQRREISCDGNVPPARDICRARDGP